MNKYRVIRRQWFDKHGVEGRIVFRVQVYREIPFMRWWRGDWRTVMHSAPPDGYQSPTDFETHEDALRFIGHVCLGGAVQEWAQEVLPEEFEL